MVFVANKKIGNKREQKLAELYDLKLPIGNGKVFVSWAAFDEERGAVFFPLGGQGGCFNEIPRYSVLIWKDNVIKIEDYESYPNVTQSGKIGSWKITDIQIPIHLKNDSNEIIEMIKEHSC